MTAKEFTERHPVGERVRYYPIAGEGSSSVTRIRSAAWTLGHGAVVVKVEGVAGGVSIDHLEVV